jgi:pSer/pThr/pTyr-binding forkhead associated (FHA) protein
MAKLILTFHGSEVGEYDLTREYTTVGRKSDNDIQVDNLAVSGHHARVIRILSDYFLEDLDSTNGTSVNGSPVKKHALRHGDVIDIGKHQLHFVNENEADQEDDLEKTVVMRPGSISSLLRPQSPPAAREERPAPAPPPPAPVTPRAAPATEAPEPTAPGDARLRILTGPNAGRELKLVKEVTTLGKRGLQVASITRRDNGYFLLHIEGGEDNTRYPVVNGAAVGPQAYRLQDHDVIEMAGIRMSFFD